MMNGYRRERVATLHKENIMRAAEHLFLEKSFIQTTIQEISKLSGYSRRTIYAYFVSKEDILYHISLQKLLILQKEVIDIIESAASFRDKYEEFCEAMTRFHQASIQSFNELGAYGAYGTKDAEGQEPAVIADIVDSVTVICTLLAELIENGKEQGLVAEDVEPAAAGQILWATISSLLDLIKVKKNYITAGLQMDDKQFLSYGFHQLLNSLLARRLPSLNGI